MKILRNVITRNINKHKTLDNRPWWWWKIYWPICIFISKCSSFTCRIVLQSRFKIEFKMECLWSLLFDSFRATWVSEGYKNEEQQILKNKYTKNIRRLSKNFSFQRVEKMFFEWILCEGSNYFRVMTHVQCSFGL